MSKTLLISEIFPPRHGGSGRWFVELYGRLSKDEYVVAAGEAAGDTQADASLADRLQVTRLPLSSKSWGLRSVSGLRFYYNSYRLLKGLIRDEGITQIHCGRCLPEGVMGWVINRRLGLPYLCYVHGEDIQTALESRELAWMIKQVFKSARMLIANSQNTAKLLREHWAVPSEQITVLHPGMDARRFLPADPDPTFLDTMGWRERSVILTVGRLQRRKGQDMLIRALPALLKRHPSVLYVVIGNGEERGALEVLVDQLDLKLHVQFLGEVDDATMIRCYQQCTLFALPNRTEGSDIEGFGMVLAEAQACGKAVLAGDSGGTRETMRIGETGEIVDCTAPEPLADALNNMLSDKGKLATMGKAARKHVCASLDWPIHVEQAARIFASMGAR